MYEVKTFPVPPPKPILPEYPFDQLNVGDGFLAPAGEKTRAHNRLRTWHKNHLDKKITVRMNPDDRNTIIIQRVA